MSCSSHTTTRYVRRKARPSALEEYRRKGSRGFQMLAILAAGASMIGASGKPRALAQAPPAAAALQDAIVEAIAKAEQSVVAISRVRRVERGREMLVPFGPAAIDPTDPNFIPNDFATGLVIAQEGLILTTSHVVRDVNSDYYITTVERRTYPARVLASDPRSDLAVLRIEASGLSPVRWGRGDELRKGQIVVALGNPYAIARDGQASASWGIVSNLRRKAPLEFDATERGAASVSPNTTLHQFGTLIQTDAKLSYGTSGGALINLQGETVGITTAMAALDGQEQAAGYAIPVDATLHRVLERLKQGREVEYGFLGVAPRNLDARERALGLVGVRVELPIAGTPADRAGLQSDDVITHVDGEPVDDADRLFLLVGCKPAGADVTLTVVKGAGSDARTVHVRLAKYRVSPGRIVTQPEAPWRGILVDYPTAQLDLRLGSGVADGVLVVHVDEQCEAWRLGLRTGMYITHVNEQEISNPREFRDIASLSAGPVRLRLRDPPSEIVVP